MHTTLMIMNIKELNKNAINQINVLIQTNLTTCKGMNEKISKEHPLVYEIFIASKLAGIYNCKNDNCLFKTISNPNLLFQSIDKMFANPELATLLDTTCKDDNQCKKAMNKRKLPEFSKQPFERQASTFTVLIERLIVEMENTYDIMTQKNPDCLTKIAELCGKYKSHRFFRIMA